MEKLKKKVFICPYLKFPEGTRFSYKIVGGSGHHVIKCQSEKCVTAEGLYNREDEGRAELSQRAGRGCRVRQGSGSDDCSKHLLIF